MNAAAGITGFLPVDMSVLIETKGGDFVMGKDKMSPT